MNNKLLLSKTMHITTLSELFIDYLRWKALRTRGKVITVSITDFVKYILSCTNMFSINSHDVYYSLIKKIAPSTFWKIILQILNNSDFTITTTTMKERRSKYYTIRKDKIEDLIKQIEIAFTRLQRTETTSSTFPSCDSLSSNATSSTLDSNVVK